MAAPVRQRRGDSGPGRRLPCDEQRARCRSRVGARDGCLQGERTARVRPTERLPFKEGVGKSGWESVSSS